MVVRLRSRQTLTDDVYESVKTLIMDHVIAPESRLSIDQLARDLAVSPTPIREALARLESDGLAIKEPLRGYTTTPILTPEQVRQLYGFRAVIEPWAAAQAARRRTAADLDEIADELDSIPGAPEAEDYESYRELANHDRRFHLLIAAMAGNEWLSGAFERTHCHLHLFRLGFTTGLGIDALRGHRTIAAAISAADPTAARIAMQDHLEAALTRLAATWGEPNGRPTAAEVGQ
ncbi:MAG TPA: GntR family transcriptional regulator [Jatrophihabitans sp.]